MSSRLWGMTSVLGVTQTGQIFQDAVVMVNNALGGSIIQSAIGLHTIDALGQAEQYINSGEPVRYEPFDTIIIISMAPTSTTCVCDIGMDSPLSWVLW